MRNSLIQKALLSLLFVSNLLAIETETIHSSLSTYVELKDYTNSKQKKDGEAIAIGADIHHKKSSYKFLYEYAHANTYQPPLQSDLKVDKLFLKYGYHFTPALCFHLNYINVLNDNIALTSHAQSYAAGISYNISKAFNIELSEFYSDFNDFTSWQSDLKLSYKFHLNEIGFKASLIGKYISLDDKEQNSFTKNAQDSYFTSGVKLHLHKNSYHMGVGAYFGKRAFAVMNDGFKLQHHAMEFDRTYAIGIGKNIANFVLRYQYIYQRAIELPINNTNVKMQVSRFILNYKFAAQ